MKNVFNTCCVCGKEYTDRLVFFNVYHGFKHSNISLPILGMAMSRVEGAVTDIKYTYPMGYAFRGPVCSLACTVRWAEEHPADIALEMARLS
jgi:hypothetical protein